MIPLQDDTQSATAPYATYALIAVCAATYCWQFSLDAGAGERVVVPARELDALGRARYALFYVACGIAAVFAQALGCPRSAYPIIGASVAFRAHIGGFVAGMLLAPVLKRRGVRLFAA